ncbi:hypothetical protein OHO83_03925 [Streptomyces sp. NBC_00569]|uniref:hypothetical protein n=1 Tax=Streptomyces sp. NBC_00569 TaxID=2975780 RepID=UPI002E802A54|nr:hypothetical protein [Streptomyces sp. NBC_00569]WUB91538.1 hypothetical protein OHO83_03925 [Streptomyces sp. NBC_00569]
MLTSTTPWRRRCAAPVLLLSAAVALTGCGTERATDTAAGLPTSLARSSPPPSAPPTPTSPPASPYVEPGVVDGAPHIGDNNAYRRTGTMSPAGEKAARREAARIEPVLKRLWGQKEWDPESVRAALLELGYAQEGSGEAGERAGGTLGVRGMDARYETDHYVTPDGAQVGLRVRADACVTAFVQETNYGVEVNGPYLETGCFEPPYGH